MSAAVGIFIFVFSFIKTFKVWSLTSDTTIVLFCYIEIAGPLALGALGALGDPLPPCGGFGGATGALPVPLPCAFGYGYTVGYAIPLADEGWGGDTSALPVPLP